MAATDRDGNILIGLNDLVDVGGGFGGGGAIEEWNLEFCASFTPTNPFVVVNDTLAVPPAQENTITQTILEVQDVDNTAEELLYTVIAVPENGVLFFAGNPLAVGDNFRQSSINATNLTYFHDGSETEFDSFLFNVTDEEGGWLPTQKFNIKIDEDAVVNTDNVFSDNQVWVYPNPANDLIHIQFESTLSEEVVIRLLNIHGQEVLKNVPNSQQFMELPVQHLPSGTYAISIESSDAILVKKIIIQH